MALVASFWGRKIAISGETEDGSGGQVVSRARTLFRVVVRVGSSVTEDLVSFRPTFRTQMSAHG